MSKGKQLCIPVIYILPKRLKKSSVYNELSESRFFNESLHRDINYLCILVHDFTYCIYTSSIRIIYYFCISDVCTTKKFILHTCTSVVLLLYIDQLQIYGFTQKMETFFEKILLSLTHTKTDETTMTIMKEKVRVDNLKGNTIMKTITCSKNYFQTWFFTSDFRNRQPQLADSFVVHIETTEQKLV